MTLEQLVQKYAGHTPRYTSYPTAVEFHDGVGNTEWLGALSRDRDECSDCGDSLAYSLYLHIPFCSSLCYFCACNKIIPKSRAGVPEYLDCLAQEIDHVGRLLGPDVPVEQIHWGGGTPNFLEPSEMERLYEHCRRVFPNTVAGADVSVEVDPRTLRQDHITTLARLGFNRISLGVQDFDPLVQDAINRRQGFELTEHVCSLARENGFSSINIDLLYGLPNQTLDGFSKTIEQVLAIRPERIALYGYAHVTWLRKVQKALERGKLPTPEERIQFFLAAIERLTNEGYIHIGLDHFALPQDDLAVTRRSGRLNRNFMGYSTHRGARVIGFGVSAISAIPRAYAQNAKDITTYQQRIRDEGLAIERGFLKSDEDCLRAEIIESLLCQGVVYPSDIRGSSSQTFRQLWQSAKESLLPFTADALLSFQDDGLVLSDRGRLFSRNIATVFDAYFAEHEKSSQKVFSQAV